MTMENAANKRRRVVPPQPADVWFCTPVASKLARPCVGPARPPAAPELYCTDTFSVEQFQLDCQVQLDHLDAELAQALQGNALQPDLACSDLQVPLQEAAEDDQKGIATEAQQPTPIHAAAGQAAAGAEAATAEQQPHQQQQQQRQQQALQLLHSYQEAMRFRGHLPRMPQHMCDDEEAADATAATGAAAVAAADTAAVAAGASEALPPYEVLLTVCVYEGVHQGLHQKPGVVLELQLLGSQPLSALRDALHCPTDTLLASVPGSAVPGAYMYIGGSFFRDDRDPNAGDPSQPIREFCARRGIAEPRFLHRRHGAFPLPGATPIDAEAPVGSMAAINWGNLKIRAGTLPLGVLSHQGCCEHALAVTDVRRLHPSDPQLPRSYPRVLWRKPPVRAEAKSECRKCQVCFRRAAKKLLAGCRDAPADPCLVCDGCCTKLAGNVAQQPQGQQQQQQGLVVYSYTGSDT